MQFFYHEERLFILGFEIYILKPKLLQVFGKTKTTTTKITFILD
jgi:hypothetical protein